MTRPARTLAPAVPLAPLAPAATPATWTVASWLSQDPAKREIYGDDPYFWEGWESFLAACSQVDSPQAVPPQADVEAALRHCTFLLVKPEAIAGRRIDVILDFLTARDFFCLGTWPVRMNRHTARALWRYQINSAPIAHIRALEMDVTAGEAFVLGLGHPLADDGASSAAEVLRVSKGSSSRPAQGTLRDQLKLPARMLNFAHAPDEPADVLRELAIVAETSLGSIMAAMAGAAGSADVARTEAGREVGGRAAVGREAVWRAAAGREAAGREARMIMTSRYSQVAAHDLDVAATFSRMRGYLRDRSRTRLPEAARSAIQLGWLPPEQALEVVASLEVAAGLPLWDRIVTVAHLTDALSTGRPMLVLPPS